MVFALDRSGKREHAGWALGVFACRVITVSGLTFNTSELVSIIQGLFQLTRSIKF